MKKLMIAVAGIAVVALSVGACSAPQDTETASSSVEGDVNTPAVEAGVQNYLGDYELVDQQYQTQTTVRLENNQRIMTTNALPNHDTGDFPNSSNPNTISAQNDTWTFPLVPTFVGTSQKVFETGVALNGVKFEPGTAELVTCDSGEAHPIEALQSVTDLGIDFNNAHVQPNGAYHYHGISSLMVEIFSSDADLVHIGFARDGHLLYYSKSGKYAPSYKIGSGKRSGSGCLYTPGQGNAVDFGSVKDGALTDDWEYDASYGDLDECNGTIIDGSYAYLITNEFPYVSRCLMGEFAEEDRGPAGAGQGPTSGANGSAPVGNGPPPKK